MIARVMAGFVSLSERLDKYGTRLLPMRMVLQSRATCSALAADVGDSATPTTAASTNLLRVIGVRICPSWTQPRPVNQSAGLATGIRPSPFVDPLWCRRRTGPASHAL